MYSRYMLHLLNSHNIPCECENQNFFLLCSVQFYKHFHSKASHIDKMLVNKLIHCFIKLNSVLHYNNFSPFVHNALVDFGSLDCKLCRLFTEWNYPSKHYSSKCKVELFVAFINAPSTCPNFEASPFVVMNCGLIRWKTWNTPVQLKLKYDVCVNVHISFEKLGDKLSGNLQTSSVASSLRLGSLRWCLKYGRIFYSKFTSFIFVELYIQTTN